MAQEWAKKFYESKPWKTTRDSIYVEQHGVCERCKGRYGPGEIVHHIMHLNRNNINNISITLGKGNLRLVCRICHALEHTVSCAEQGLMFNEEGELIEDKSIYN